MSGDVPLYEHDVQCRQSRGNCPTRDIPGLCATLVDEPRTTHSFNKLSMKHLSARRRRSDDKVTWSVNDDNVVRRIHDGRTDGPTMKRGALQPQCTTMSTLLAFIDIRMLAGQACICSGQLLEGYTRLKLPTAQIDTVQGYWRMRLPAVPKEVDTKYYRGSRY